MCGHTVGRSAQLYGRFFGDLGLALSKINDGMKEKGKGKAAQEDSKGPASPPSRVDSSQTPPGSVMESVEALEAMFERKTGLKSWRFLSSLAWVLTPGGKADEKLRIGRRNSKAVFAYFDPRGGAFHTISIRKDSDRADIAKADLHTVSFNKPYNRLPLENGGSSVGQSFRTFLKGLFILKSHSRGFVVSIDVRAFGKMADHVMGKSVSNKDKALQSPSGTSEPLELPSYLQSMEHDWTSRTMSQISQHSKFLTTQSTLPGLSAHEARPKPLRPEQVSPSLTTTSRNPSMTSLPESSTKKLAVSPSTQPSPASLGSGWTPVNVAFLHSWHLLQNPDLNTISRTSPNLGVNRLSPTPSDEADTKSDVKKCIVSSGAKLADSRSRKTIYANSDTINVEIPQTKEEDTQTVLESGDSSPSPGDASLLLEYKDTLYSLSKRIEARQSYLQAIAGYSAKLLAIEQSLAELKVKEFQRCKQIYCELAHSTARDLEDTAKSGDIYEMLNRRRHEEHENILAYRAEIGTFREKMQSTHKATLEVKGAVEKQVQELSDKIKEQETKKRKLQVDGGFALGAAFAEKDGSGSENSKRRRTG